MNMLSMQISPGVWPAHGTKINLKISQRTFGVAERWGRGSTRTWTSSQGKGRAPACQRHIWSAKREKRGAGLRLECWRGEREGERGAARQRTREFLCVCPGSRARNNKALHTPSQAQELPEILGDVSRQQSCLSKPTLDLTRLEKKAATCHFQFYHITFRDFLCFKQSSSKPTDFQHLQKGFLDTLRESKHLIFSSLSTLNIRQHASSEDDTCTWHKNIQFKFREKRRI